MTFRRIRWILLLLLCAIMVSAFVSELQADYVSAQQNATGTTPNNQQAYLPTAAFTVQGDLKTKSGTGLPNAPVKIGFFDQIYSTTTDSSGVFRKTLTVPANASDGIYYVTAAFAPQGVFGPAFNLTSIEVYHEPLEVTLNASSLSFSGFTSKIWGTVRANGSLLSNTNVAINLPWGAYHTTTDPSGSFNFTVPIPITVFAFSQTFAASFTPSESYISPAQSSKTIGIFNPLIAIIPVILAGVGLYEAKSLGLLKITRKRKGTQTLAQEQDEEEEDQESAKARIDNLVESKIAQSDAGERSELAEMYKEALLLAERKLNLRFRPSSTIREISSEVEAGAPFEDQLKEAGSKPFSQISVVFEDFLYGKDFDSSRIEIARASLLELRKLWISTK